MRDALYAAALFIGLMMFSTGHSQSFSVEGATRNSTVPSVNGGDGSSVVEALRSGIPLSLSAALQIGLDNNPEIRSSSEKINVARGRRLSAVAPAAADFSIANDYVPKGRKLKDYGERTVGVSQTIEFPTNYLFRGSKYSIEKKIAENESEMMRLGIISKVKKSYFTVLALQEQLGIAGENLDIARDFVRKAEVRHSVGEGTNLEKLTANVSVTEAKNNVAVIKNHLRSAFSALNYSMGNGRGETSIYHLTDSLRFIRCDITFDKLIETAASAHPLLKENKLLVESGRVDKTLAVTSVLPEFNLGLFNKQVRGDAGYYGASFSLGIPLWFMMDQRGKILEASANEAAARADLKAADNEVYTNASAAFAEFEHEENQVQLYVNEILPQAAAIYQTAAKSYEAGEISYIEFLQAQQTHINSKSSYTDALLSYNLSIVALEEAIGTTLK